jgi:hypothetical protein
MVDKIKEYLSKKIEESKTETNLNNELTDLLLFIEEEEIKKINAEVHEIEKDLENIIDFDEWAAREYGETKVDYNGTAWNLYKAGYRKIKS